ncbi:MAG: hypothetical protein A2X35_12260 [Elusimicrobia bacterium GWA2_61_42]|nr:MAG: hypothetical protein A2X35_12260 [Elusimicrobia bacterium GWA2_61_42]OGR80507.1 MAG: hypothetical protein A2X38_02885 [Elusimicrobia bacterium GWC2_61_25]
MLTKGAVEDLIMQHLRPGPGAAPAPRKVRELGKKVFISDWELRRLYKPDSKTINVPANAIVSPLSVDWLDYNNVTVIRA